jgi:single-strand DNA-binding protein
MVAKLTLVGNLGVDPEVRYSADGKPVLSFSVASNYRKRDASTGEWGDATNWYRVKVFGRQAERLSELVSAGRLIKGTRVVVFGRLEAGAYMDRNNQPQPSLELISDEVVFAESRPRGEGEFGSGDFEASPGRSSRPAVAQPADATDLEDLPF